MRIRRVVIGNTEFAWRLSVNGPYWCQKTGNHRCKACWTLKWPGTKWYGRNLSTAICEDCHSTPMLQSGELSDAPVATNDVFDFPVIWQAQSN